MSQVEITDLQTAMLKQFSLGQAEELSESALAEIKKNKLTPTPLFYSLFFTYFSGSYNVLNEKIDSILESDDELSFVQAKKLFLRFFSQNSETLDDVYYDMLNTSTQLASVISNITKKNNATHQNLEHHLEELVKAQDSEDVDLIMVSIIKSTQSFMQESQQMQHELVSSLEVIHELKKELYTARRELVIDSLTGLSNYKGFMLALEKNIRINQSDPVPLSLISVDIDYFSAINESHGTLAGDRVIATVSQKLSLLIRRGDCISRNEADTFLILLIGTSIENAYSVAEKMRIALQKLRIKRISTGVSIGTITASFGVAEYNPVDEPSLLINKAVTAMETAKKNGRNTVEKYHEL